MIFILFCQMMSYYCTKISCSNLSDIYHPIKNPIDLSWNDYKYEVLALNQRINYTFLEYHTNFNHDISFYIKTKRIKIKGFESLPLVMKLYGNNEWVEVKRTEASQGLGTDNVLNRSIFYEGKINVVIHITTFCITRLRFMIMQFL